MMIFFSKILVAYDGSELSEKALKTAMKLAMTDKRIELHVVHVLKPLPVLDWMGTGQEQVKALLKEKAECMLQEVKESLESMGNPIKVKLMENRPEKQIIQYAQEMHMDLIVMGSHGNSGLKELFLGSVSHYVVQHSHVPTLIVK